MRTTATPPIRSFRGQDIAAFNAIDHEQVESSVRMGIGEAANTGSARMKERLGFRTMHVFRDVDRKHGRWLDTVQMQRALDDGDACDLL